MSAVRAELLVHACTAPEAALANAFPQERSPITTWSQWLDRATNRDSDRQIARKAGLTHTTIGRWRRSGEAAAEGVVAIARAYGADPIEGLLEAGILTDRDLIDTALRNAVRRAPTVYLTDELHERATAARARGDVDSVRHMFRGWR